MLGPLASSHAHATSLSPAQADCQTFRSRLDPSLVQGFLNVPEDWNQPRGRKIRVFYYARLLRDSSGAVIRPTVFFNGGPANDSHSSYDTLEHRSSAQTLSMIYLDQRGTGCSDPYPESPISLSTARRLTLYGSRSIVRDAEALRAQLLGKDGKWAAFGQSYGGEIVQRYIELAPAGLTSAFAHGAALVSDPITKITGRLGAQLRVSRDYFAVYPGDEPRLRAIRAAIPATRCFEDGASRVCGPEVLDAATILLGFRTDWDSLHQWLGSLMGAAGKLDDPTLENFVRTLVFGVYTQSGFAASVLSYQEVAPGYTDNTACQASLVKLQQSPETTSPANWPINECRLLMALHGPWDQILPQLGHGDPVSLDHVAAQLNQAPNLRFFLYSGGEDVFVPVSIFSEEVARLGSRITYRNFPDSGHDGFYTEEKIWDDLNSN